jgi:predicted ArsR family transcriptional regulator
MEKLSAVGDPELRSALLFARSRPIRITVDDLAAEQGVHRNVARSRLERLVDAGLLTSGYERRSGRAGPGAGRPAKVFGVAPELTSIEFPDRRYEVLVGHLLDELPALGKTARLRAAGTAFGSDLAGAAGLEPARTIRTGVERMCAAVGRLGYQASIEQLSADGAIISTPTCPLRPLVRTRPKASEIDRGVWAGLAAAALGVPVEHVACETCDCRADQSACRVLITVSKGGG